MRYIVETVKRAREKGVPLIGISTSDQQATVEVLMRELKEEGAPVPLIQWDFCNSFQAQGQVAQAVLAEMLNGKDARAFNGKPGDALQAARGLEKPCLLVFHNAARYLDALPVIQAIANLREPFKEAGVMLALLGHGLHLPVELVGDVLLFDEPLPNDEQLQAMLTDLVGGQDLDFAVPSSAIDALRGLAMFPAEQVAALALRKTGFDLAGLWERKRQMIEATPGLSVWRGTAKFDDLGGVARIKQYLRAVLAGRRAPRVVVVIDEIEKMLGGSGDTSGVAQDYLGTLLSYMQDQQTQGVIFIGPPGGAKTAVAQAAGNEIGIPTIALDLGGMKGSLVGQSEQRLRTALKTITAIGGGQVLFVATCNKIAKLPPELRRRFNRGTFFFDLPTRAERAVIWQLYCEKYELPLFDGEQFDDTDWTGAEIAQCTQMAYELNLELAEAAKYVVPVAKAAHEDIAALRGQAAGRFLSASCEGVYQIPSNPETATPKSKRRMAVE
jgi:hypothetical protein